MTTPTTPTTTLSNNNHSNHSSNNNNNNTSSTSSTPLQSRREMTYPSPLPSPVIVEQKRKTLILDLDETLVHSTTQEMGQYDLNVEVSIEGFQITMFVSKRPYLDFFLEVCVCYMFVFERLFCIHVCLFFVFFRALQSGMMLSFSLLLYLNMHQSSSTQSIQRKLLKKDYTDK